METEIALTDNELNTRETVNRAVALLRGGEIVALPTETVYGLGADALNPAAVAKIFEAKERPYFDPLIVHLPNKTMLRDVAGSSSSSFFCSSRIFSLCFSFEGLAASISCSSCFDGFSS